MPSTKGLLARLWISAACGALGACDTGAVGIEDCRQIERARCEAALHCDLGLETSDDVEACKRFARDNCLRGLNVDKTPSSTELRQCVQVIQAAGHCAESHSAAVPAADCEGLASVRGAHLACEVVETPELSRTCAFLVPDPPEDEEEDPEDPEADPPAGADGDGGA
jgi:hypothetical protein